MKKFLALVLAMMMVLSLCACKRIEKDPDETTDSQVVTTAPHETTEKEPEDTTEPIVEINKETAVRIAKDYLGERDPDTGYLYSYQFVETTSEGEFKIRVSWYLEEDERYSTCGYLLVSAKGEVTKFDW